MYIIPSIHLCIYISAKWYLIIIISTYIIVGSHWNLVHSVREPVRRKVGLYD